MSDTPISSEGINVFRPKPNLPPPPNTTGAMGWLRFNLFDGWFNSVLTIISFICLIYIFLAFYDWAFAKAVWEASTRQECRITPTEFGTCWAGVDFWITRFVYGRYPDDQIWRVNLAAIIFVAWMIPLWLPNVTSKLVVGLSVVLIYPFLAGYIFLGGERNWVMAVLVPLSITWFISVMIHVCLCLITKRGLGQWIVLGTGFTKRDERTH